MVKKKAKQKCPTCNSSRFNSNEKGEKRCLKCGYIWKPMKSLEEIKKQEV